MSNPESSVTDVEPIAIVVEVDIDAVSEFKDIQYQHPDAIAIADVKRFGGEMGYMAVVVTLSAAIIPALTKVLVERIRAKRFVRVKLRGIELSGISEDTVKDILIKVLERDGL